MRSISLACYHPVVTLAPPSSPVAVHPAPIRLAPPSLLTTPWRPSLFTPRVPVASVPQLCINFTNEKLQATFNQAIFHAAMEENAEEDVNVEVADMTEIDNAEVIELIEGKPSGILSILNEECVVPKGSDESFLGKLMDTHRDNALLRRPTKEQSRDACAFTVVHFVGPVVYSATGMLIKNKDPVSQDLMVLLQHSSSRWVKSLFGDTGADQARAAAAPQGGRKDARFKGVAAKFQQQACAVSA